LNIPQPPVRESINGLLSVSWLAYFTQLTKVITEFAAKIANLIAHNTGTNTGDQPSIVGITGTIDEFNTALTDADFATGGGTATGVNTGDNAVNTLYSSLVSNATHTGDATGSMALTVKGINNTLLSGLDTGILKNTTTTGVPSIALAADFPTLNQNTSGTAAKATILATTRAIYGNNFDGSAALTQIIASTYGGTGNGFAKFTGPATSEKTFTLPNSSETLLYSGGALGTPASGIVTNLTGTASININGTVGATTAATGKFTTTELTGINFYGDANTWLTKSRTVVANTAGYAISITGGGATSGATNKSGGNMALAGGLSTGTGTSGVILYGNGGTVSGTTDGTNKIGVYVLNDKLGFYGATPVIKAAAPTAATATAPAGGTGATAGAYDTAAHRDTAIAAINNLMTRVAYLETVLSNLGLTT
jgi:hypothetical protein